MRMLSLWAPPRADDIRVARERPPRSAAIKRPYLGVALAAAILGATATFAQEQPRLPSTAQPGAVERQLQKPPQPMLPGRHTLPALVVPNRAPPGAESVTFALRRVDLEGAHAIPAKVLAATYRQELGKTVPLSRIYAIANAMTAIYRKRGYLLSSVLVPAQEIHDGEVRLDVVEGYLHDVTFQGYQGMRKGLFSAMRTRLLADRPLRTATLERAMLLLNNLPGMQAEAILKPASSETGAADLVVRLHRTALTATAGFNNRGATVEGPDQIEGTVGLNSPLGNFGGTTFQYLQATQASKLRLYGGSDVERLTSNGLDLVLSGSHSSSRPALGADEAAYNLATDTTLARAELDYPIVLTRPTSVTLRLALTYEDATFSSFGQDVSDDRLASVRAGIRWDHLDGWYGVNLIDAEYSHGLNALGASPFGSPTASRPGGYPDFSKMTLYVARLQSLGGPFSILLAANGQYAFDRLLEAEEFGFGGEIFGRAYDPSEFVGDSAAAGKAELRYTLETPFGIAATLYVFADRGEVWRRLLPDEAGQPRTEAASSDGGGLRLSLGPWLSGYVEVAKPLDHVVSALGNERTRVFAGLQAQLGL
jgi:hemolysin activation/secretion protein